MKLMTERLIEMRGDEATIHDAKCAHALSWFKRAGVSSSQYVCIDATGRICGMGKQMMSARDRNAFPVVVYHIEPLEQPE